MLLHHVIPVGVGDLYTDPQIHTANGKDYGDANLGPAGMALFFSTHKCNRLVDKNTMKYFNNVCNQ